MSTGRTGESVTSLAKRGSKAAKTPPQRLRTGKCASRERKGFRSEGGEGNPRGLATNRGGELETSVGSFRTRERSPFLIAGRARVSLGEGW